MALLVLAVAVGALVGTMFSARRLDQVNESRAAANQALRTVLEDMKAQEFSTVYAAFNTSSADDPNPDYGAPPTRLRCKSRRRRNAAAGAGGPG